MPRRNVIAIVALIGFAALVAELLLSTGGVLAGLGVLGLIAGGATFASAAVFVPPAQTLSVTSLAYPLYVAVSMAAACVLVLTRRRKHAAQAVAAGHAGSPDEAVIAQV